MVRDSYISRGLGFSPEDRRLHLLRVAEICRILNLYTDVVACFVSPMQAVRQEIKEIIGKVSFVYIKCDVGECKRRDVKGMWKKAMAGEINDFTGVQAVYQEPVKADIVVETDKFPVSVCLGMLMQLYNYHKDTRRYCVYIGRWSPFHNGHYAIIKRKLDEGKNVLILIRDTPLSKENPWTAQERFQMINAVFANDKRVQIKIVPDVESVVIGRNVGYGVEEMKMPEKVETISGTEIRKRLQNGGDWQSFVPSKVKVFLQNYNGLFCK